MMQENQAASQPAELKIGTVTRTAPLEISINPQMAPLRSGLLYLTSAVVERKIPVLAHSHTTQGLAHSHTTGGLGHTHALNGTGTDPALDGSYASSEALEQDSFTSSQALTELSCLENGAPLPVRDGYILLNRGLETGDRVLMLRVQHGQKFVVLSRLFEGV